jgi:Restriction endonuclease EcoRII, N-terminal./EcoRII C terminal.
MELKDWISEVANDDWLIYIKRLSANDTGATKSHQAGIYVPKPILSTIFPSLDTITSPNPDILFKAKVDSDDVPEQELRAVYYNQKSRNEKRITCWKEGVKYSPITDEEKTGSIGIFAFKNVIDGDSDYLKVWVCRDLNEEEFLEDKLGPVDPQSVYFDKGNIIFECLSLLGKVKSVKYPDEWNTTFPSGVDIIDHLLKGGKHKEKTVDKRLIERRNNEFNLFKLIEEHHSLPLIKDGFDNIEEFIKTANSISNRRKSRSGRSLELHLENIFQEEGLNKYGSQCTTERKKKPDFLFPDCKSYHDKTYPKDNLRMLAVKTTVKDRWRQILNEADRIEVLHLFTLQAGVSKNQFLEMKAENVVLVVPKPLHEKYPKEIRGELMSLTDFIESTKLLAICPQ